MNLLSGNISGFSVKTMIHYLEKEPVNTLSWNQKLHMCPTWGKEERMPRRPCCQVSGCFEPASVYVVIREADLDPARTSIMPCTEGDRNEDRDLNTFKLILHLCARHDYDFKYLLSSNELEIAKRRHLALHEAQ